MLDAVGIAPDEELVYRTLLLTRNDRVFELAAALDRTETDIARLVGALEGLGLVSRADDEPERLIAARPDVAVDLLAASRRAELDRAQQGARDLLRLMQQDERHRPENLVEVVVGRSMIASRFSQLLGETNRDLWVIDRPPYAAPSDESDDTVRGLMGAGVRVRGIYSPDSLEIPGAVDEAFSAADAGEVSRIHPKVPMKLAIFDGAAALLPLSINTADDETLVDSALVVRPCALLDALVEMFWLLWEQAIPVVPQSAGPTGPADQRLLTMLASGLKDDAIARHLDISSRTVGRRVADLMDGLGARTRFQAGVHAQRRNLLGAPAESPPR
ncbi:MAG: LuxR C-terminal-related transcriptional regulator [Nocardioidaceae bacterium]